MLPGENLAFHSLHNLAPDANHLIKQGWWRYLRSKDENRRIKTSPMVEVPPEEDTKFTKKKS
jgi:hypothetical protein